MGRRSTSAALSGACIALTVATGLAQNIPVPPLPYSYSGLVPFISEHALRVSHKQRGVIQEDT